MSDVDVEMPPGPDPALQRLEKLVGTWDMKGNTLDTEESNIFGRTSFEWLPGGFFLQQRIEMNFAGFEIQSLELIGYDAEADVFTSSVYSNVWGTPAPYKWDLRGDTLTIEMDMAAFSGKFSGDDSFAGGWRPKPGRENDPGNIAYDISGTRVK